ncbi:asparagine synthase (glutamine-hydrolyzing) [Kutzneria sp. CA-103260]|uniref:asparagine synthase (glutamine-hydrolyzing) n=1 Tax=Kutzneria sp. CA-103260 TaxID=2802641 RepID=UPI001BA8D46F|nr:asparagine synthase (glutamine-hydrolyzing) [Kutzneria sp. CA-103260]QUQ66154.1 asparagine synthase (glutamine-hydrolyzing) [Kutzneria sp. CA-103260]
MCGISGWVDFERDLAGQAPVGRAMADTMACRGPDAHGTWTDQHAVLAHRRLSIIDIEGGRQPMAVGDLAVMTYSGEVYNYRELRAQLEGAGHAFTTDSDTEVVLRAYLEWGESFVDRLNGMYAFAIWDRRTRQLLLVRDRMGIKPLFYFPMPHGVLFASEPKAILAHPDVRTEVDIDGLRELFGFAKTPERSIYRGMSEVRPGQLVRVDRRGIVKRRYWQLTAQEHTDDLDTTITTVRGLLEDIVRRQLISDVPLCTLLSGGLDSSAITALAARALDVPVRSFAVDFAGYTENFTPDPHRGSDTPDAPYVHELAEFVQADHTDIVLSTADLMDPAARAAVLRASDDPAHAGDGHTSLYLLFRAIRARSTVALSGESADEVFGGYRQFHDPDVVSADTFPWLAGLGRAAAGRSILAEDFLAALDMPAFRADSYRAALAEVPHLDGVTGHERRMREICYLYLTRFLPILLDRKDRMSMASGLEVRVPFCDHRLVQYVFNTPWAMKTFDGREKSLLRAATKDVLPESIAQRRKSPYPRTQDPSYGQALRDALGDVLADREAPVRRLLDVPKAKDMLLRTADQGRSLAAGRAGVERVLGLNSWLSTHRVDLLI